MKKVISIASLLVSVNLFASPLAMPVSIPFGDLNNLTCTTRGGTYELENQRESLTMFKANNSKDQAVAFNLSLKSSEIPGEFNDVFLPTKNATVLPTDYYTTYTWKMSDRTIRIKLWKAPNQDMQHQIYWVAEILHLDGSFSSRGTFTSPCTGRN